MRDFEFKVKNALDQFYGVQPQRLGAGFGNASSPGLKSQPIFRKVYIQYKTQEIGSKNPMKDEESNVFSQG